MKIIKKIILGVHISITWGILTPIYGMLFGRFLYPRETTNIIHAMTQFFAHNVHGCKLIYHDEQMKEKIQAAGPVILLHNHQATADFFLCLLATTPGRTCYISRWAVFFLSPIACTISVLNRGIIFFNRSKHNPRKAGLRLFSKIQKRLNQGISLIVFPEGTRHVGDRPEPLKKGVLSWAYKNNIKCAIVLQHGNADVICTKTANMKRNVNIHTLHEGIFDPNEYSSKKDFIKTIETRFQSGYKRLMQKSKTEL